MAAFVFAGGRTGLASAEPQLGKFWSSGDGNELDSQAQSLYNEHAGAPLVVSMESGSGGFWNQVSREFAVQISFESLEVSKLHVGVEPVFALVGHGRHTGIAANVGLAHYSALPIWDGYALWPGTKHWGYVAPIELPDGNEITPALEESVFINS